MKIEFNSKIETGFETIVFLAKKGTEDFCSLKCINKDGRDIQIKISITAIPDELTDQICYMFTEIESH